MESNIYTTKIYDIIVSDDAIVHQHEVEEAKGDNYIKICLKANSDSHVQESTYVNL